MGSIDHASIGKRRPGPSVGRALRPGRQAARQAARRPGRQARQAAGGGAGEVQEAAPEFLDVQMKLQMFATFLKFKNYQYVIFGPEVVNL